MKGGETMAYTEANGVWSEYDNDGSAKDFRGLSTDQKPVTGVPNGSTFYEMDTHSVYMFDADGSAWIKQ